MKHVIQSISLHTIQIMSLTVLLLLTTISLVCSCHIDTNEHVYYTYLTPWNILVLLSVLGFLFFLYFKRSSLPIPDIKLLLCVSFMIGIVFVLATRCVPKADQYVCFTIAKQMHAKDFSSFAPTAYMQIYPQQIGIVLFYYFLGFVVGPSNTLAIQILNVVWYVCFILYTYKITYRMFKSRKLASFTVCLTLLFTPLLVYTSFVYGTMPGLAFSSFAIYKAMDFMEDHSMKSALLMALFASIAIVFKKNYLIVLIAILLVVAIHILLSEKRRLIILLLLPIAFTLLLSKGSTRLCEQITGEKIGQGMPSIAWVTMGLQNSYRANGWYNSYSLKTYQEQKLNAKATSAIAMKDLRQRLHEFSSDKAMAARFFVGKISSEWNDSTFQCLIINNITMITSKSSPFLFGIVSHCGHPALLAYLDVLLKLIYLGILLYLIVERKNMKIESMIPVVAFLGGFLFHMAWEAKSQYTIGYFILLFPYCLKGYYSWFRRLEEILHNVTARKVLVPALAPVLYLGVTFLCYGFIATNAVFFTTIKSSNNEYQSFLAQVPFEPPELHGNYRLRAQDSKEYLNFTNKVTINKNKTSSQILNITQTASTTNILAAKQGEDLNHYKLEATGNLPAKLPDVYEVIHTVTWKLAPLPDHTYILCNNKNYAYTRTKDHKVILSPYSSQNKNQKWILEGV